MCYARRQRSSWARIKLSNKLYINRLRSTSSVSSLWLFLLFEYASRLSGCVSKNDEIFALASFLLVLKSPVVQLSMINRGFDSVLAFPLPVLPRLSRGQLIYYTTFASTCQEVFKTFFKKVLSLPFGRRLLVPFRKACWLYHISCRLSRGWWRFFFGGCSVIICTTAAPPDDAPRSVMSETLSSDIILSNIFAKKANA